ncbi:MAG: LuxR C-terminal-related transcriptional regulator [Bacteroidota bacterium]
MKSPIDKYKEIVASHSKFIGTDIEEQINKFRVIDQLYPSSQSFFMILNASTMQYEWISKNFKQVMGFDPEALKNGGPNFLISMIHPEDLSTWLRLAGDLLNYKPEKKILAEDKKLLFTYNYRLKNSSGIYLNITVHSTPIEFDKRGKPVVSISHYTVTGEDKNNAITGSIKFLNENDVYETLYHKNYTHEDLSDKLTKREIDIINELSLENSSKEIAKRLFISQHTVDQHRRNILKKLDFKSTGELIQYCKTNNFF